MSEINTHAEREECYCPMMSSDLCADYISIGVIDYLINVSAVSLQCKSKSEIDSEIGRAHV